MRTLRSVITAVLLLGSSGCGESAATTNPAPAADAAHDVPTETSSDSAAAQDADSEPVPNDGGVLFEQVRLEIPGEVQGWGCFDVETAGERAWVSAYTVITPEPGWTDNGPMLLWERTGDGAFEAVALPSTTISYFPRVCAVSEQEAYVVVVDGAASDGRLFARVDQASPAFEEQQLPPPPAGHQFMSLHLSCRPGGELWLYGQAQPGDDLMSSIPVLYHRDDTSASWNAVALSAELLEPSWGLGITSALIRADGSGLFAFYYGETTEVDELSASGSWTQVFNASGHDVGLIHGMIGDSSSWAFAGFQPGIDATAGGFLRMQGGVWNVDSVGANEDIWACAMDGSGNIFLAGSKRGAATWQTVLIDPDKNPWIPPQPGGFDDVAAYPNAAGHLLACVSGTATPETNGLYEIRLGL